ncbi:MAG: hypothetical protein IKN04_05335, partial [Clostridia bacterium]|nr:hypothetical protein [Clostridia bacterium]
MRFRTLGPPRPQTLRQGMIPCTLTCGYYLTRKESKLPLLLGRNVQIDSLVLLARPLKAANPDAKHPGKAGKIPGG